MKQKIGWSVILAAYILFIYSNSLQPAVISSGRSTAVLAMAQRMLAAAGFSGLGFTEHMIRKMAHFAEYTLLGMLLWQNVRSYCLTGREQIQWTMLLGIMIPLIDETIQLFVEGRSGQISDVWLDMAGVTWGVLVLLICSRLFKGMRRKNFDREKL